MNKQDFLTAISWPADKSDDTGSVSWSSNPLLDRGIRASATKGADGVDMKVDVWGVDGMPGAPLEARVVFANDQASLATGSIIGRPATLFDVVHEFGRYTEQTKSLPALQLDAASARPRP